MVLLLMSIMKSVDYAVLVNCIEDIECKLKTVIPVLKVFIMINVISGKILTLD